MNKANRKHHSSCSTWPSTFIHFILSDFPGGACNNSRPDFSIPSRKFQLFLGDHQTSSIQLGDIISPADSGAAWSLYNSSKSRLGGILFMCLNHVHWPFSIERSNGSVLRLSWIVPDCHHPVMKSKSTNPVVEPYSFSHYPQLVTTGEWRAWESTNWAPAAPPLERPLEKISENRSLTKTNSNDPPERRVYSNLASHITWLNSAQNANMEQRWWPASDHCNGNWLCGPLHQTSAFYLNQSFTRR